jgi:cubilin
LLLIVFQFASPGYPSDYPNSQNCIYLLITEDAKIIQLSFTSFQTQLNYDYVKIYDGMFVISPLIAS